MRKAARDQRPCFLSLYDLAEKYNISLQRPQYFSHLDAVLIYSGWTELSILFYVFITYLLHIYYLYWKNKNNCFITDLHREKLCILAAVHLIFVKCIFMAAMRLGPVYPRGLVLLQSRASGWSEPRCRLLITRWLLKRGAQTLWPLSLASQSRGAGAHGIRPVIQLCV